MMAQAGFGEIDVALNAAQDLVADHVLVAKVNDRPALGQKGFVLEPLEFRGEEAKRSAGTLRFSAFHLPDVVLVFNAQALERIGLGGIAFGDFIETGEGIPVGFKPSLAFFLFHRTIIFDAQPANERGQA